MRRTHAAAILAASILMLSAALPARAQGVLAGRRVCVLTIQNLTAGDDFAEYETSITDTIEQELAAAGARVISSSTWVKSPGVPRDTRDLLRGPIALAVARDADADLAVNGSYTVEDEQILVSVQCWDVAARAPVSGFLRTWRFNLAFYNSLHDEMVSRLIPRLASRGARGAEDASGAEGGGSAGDATMGVSLPPRTDIRFVSSQDAVEVLIEGETLAGVIENGRLDWTAGALPTGSKLRVLKKREGFHPSWQTIRVAPEVALSPLSKTAMEGIELDWTLGQMVGLGATLRGYWKPDSLYRWFSSYLFLQLPMTSTGRPYFHYDTGLGIGGYILPPGSAVRISLTTGIGAIFSIQGQPGATMFTDFYLNPLSWAVEAKLWGVTMFLRQEYKYTLGVGDNLLGRNLMTVSGTMPPLTLGVLFRR